MHHLGYGKFVSQLMGSHKVGSTTDMINTISSRRGTNDNNNIVATNAKEEKETQTQTSDTNPHHDEETIAVLQKRITAIENGQCEIKEILQDIIESLESNSSCELSSYSSQDDGLT